MQKYPTKKWFKDQSKRMIAPILEPEELIIELTDEEKNLVRQVAEKHCLNSKEIIQVFDKSLITISLDDDFKSEKSLNDLSEFIAFLRRYIIVASDDESPRLLLSVYAT